MASANVNDLLKRVTLEGVEPLNIELGRGAYGRVFKVKYCGLVCAAKQIHQTLIDSEQKQAFKDDFVRECLNSSEIRHPNVVQFIGVYYSDEQPDIPTMVMELMNTSLTSFIQNNRSNISITTKISILVDVSLGLSCLHLRNPPVIHRDLSSNNVMLTKQFVAKIGDLGVAKVVRPESRNTKRKLTTNPGTVDFMPPETLEEEPIYDTPVDVFSFAAISLHLLCEEWPTPVGSKRRDPKTRKLYALTEVERRQRYFDKITDRVAMQLIQMTIRCLDDDPDARPAIREVSETIEPLKEGDLQPSSQPVKSNANQSVSFISETSVESANTKCTLTHAEEQFKITTWLPRQPVQCSSSAANQPFTDGNSARMIPQMQTSRQQSQSVESQNVTQNLHHPLETLNLQQSVMEQQPPLVAMQESDDSQNMSKEFEQSNSEVVDHQLDECIQTEVMQQDLQHTTKTLPTVSEKLDESAISEFNAEEQYDMTAQSSHQSSSTKIVENNSVIVHEPEKKILQMQGSDPHNQSVESQDVTQNPSHPLEALQSVMEQQQPLQESKQQDQLTRGMFYKVKVIFIGSSAVGKTSIVQRYCDDIFTTQTLTVGVDTRVKRVEIDNNLIEFAIWDTVGQERYKSLTTSYYRNKDVIIIVFDLTRPTTCESLVEWIEEAREQNPEAYTIIVGNKSDHEDRSVSTEDGASIASQYGMQYFETSAKNADVEKIFIHLAQKIPQILPGTPISPTGKETKRAYSKQRSRTFSQSEKIILTNSKPAKKCCK